MIHKIFKRKLRSFTFFLPFSLGSMFLSAQNIDQLRSVLPPSPTAASLGKYADWPVSLYTGVPNISVPIYDLKGRTTSVPVTLDYHASGIKVSEVASWVGLGFSLNAGGVITRSVRGLPDDNGGYLQYRRNYVDPGTLLPPTIASPSLTDSAYLYKCATGTADSEPDYYMLNAMGRSYKIIFSRNDEIITQPASNIKITCNLNGTNWFSELTSWKVVLEDGTQLIFGNQSNCLERIQNAQYGNGTVNGVTSVISSWYLYKIISPLSESVTFTYGSETVWQVQTLSQRDQMTTVYSPPMKNSGFRGHVDAKFLKKIETETDSMVFVPKNRSDLASGNALSEIKVYSKLGLGMIRRFKLGHTYTQSSIGNNYYQDPDGVYRYRLRLLWLKEYPSSTDSSTVRKWSFDYNSTNLPYLTSYAQDHWGYYNGADNNTTLLPLNLGFVPTVAPYGNRAPNPSTMMAGMMSKITYPTGGYSLFNYEPNSIQISEDQYATTTIDLILDSNTSSTTTTSPFTVTKAQLTSMTLSGTFGNLASYGNTVSLASVVVRDQNNQPVGSLGIVKTDVVGSAAYFSTSFVLNPGTYTLECKRVDPTDVVSTEGILTYQRNIGPGVTTKPVGGVRVASIYDYDNQTSTVKKRLFQYENPFVIHPISDSDYLLDSYKTRSYSVNTQEISYTELVYTARYSIIRASLGDIQGGTIGYGKVTTLYDANGANGKTVSYFSSDADYEVMQFPFPPAVSNSWRRGLLQKQIDYDGNGYLLRKQANTYSFDNPITLNPFISSLKFTLLSDQMAFTFLGDVITRVQYQIINEQVNHMNALNVQYVRRADGHYDSLVSIQNFYYDTPGNLQATRIETVDSKGVARKVVQRTAFEKSAIVASASLSTANQTAIDSMLFVRNMVGPILQREEYVNGAMTTRATTNFKVWYTNPFPAIIAPENVQLQVGTNPLETRVKFSNYDAKGNLTEQSKSNDVVHSYVYDYGSSKPIAEVTNSDAVSIAYTSFESDGKGGWNFTGSGTSDATAVTGTKSFQLTSSLSITRSIANSQKFSLSYWTKGTVTVTATGGTATLARTYAGVGGWSYYEYAIANATSLSLSVDSGSTSIDELRLYPTGALMTTYTYHPDFGVTSSADASSAVTYYEYDKMGRLAVIRDNKRKVLKSYQYNYQK